ncbi:hypothetical protein B0T26DRAFT_464433 [Lasiosphaeria miniovina]|uniref:Uncharacterized protein n=1 Tax=Lasiosphaeria miniovina TaxID=1954250 RepID=A0AA39ZZP3_9PEZI|nr:uncharacterized protein B0T26DRAFT_464433 [Lasiosphaeria miniovina]KAK0706628.1 hypothetical protein B0T26DRAFT_464433 [Lasiosphaeria miniovina]
MGTRSRYHVWSTIGGVCLSVYSLSLPLFGRGLKWAGTGVASSLCFIMDSTLGSVGCWFPYIPSFSVSSYRQMLVLNVLFLSLSILSLFLPGQTPDDVCGDPFYLSIE